MTQIALSTLNHIITLELMALATITQIKATIYKTWQQLAMKWQHLVIMGDCTEHDKTFTLDLPTLPDVMFDSDYSSEPVELLLDSGMTIFSLGLCHKMTSTEFVELVRQTVSCRNFNISPKGFNSTVNLDDDSGKIKFWFDQYINDDRYR